MLSKCNKASAQGNETEICKLMQISALIMSLKRKSLQPDIPNAT